MPRIESDALFNQEYDKARTELDKAVAEISKAYEAYLIDGAGTGRGRSADCAAGQDDERRETLRQSIRDHFAPRTRATN